MSAPRSSKMRVPKVTEKRKKVILALSAEDHFNFKKRSNEMNRSMSDIMREFVIGFTYSTEESA